MKSARNGSTVFRFAANDHLAKKIAHHRLLCIHFFLTFLSLPLLTSQSRLHTYIPLSISLTHLTNVFHSSSVCIQSTVFLQLHHTSTVQEHPQPHNHSYTLSCA